MALWEDLVIEFSQLNTNEATKRAEEFSVEEIEVLEQQETLVSSFQEQIPIIYSSLQASGARKWPRTLYSILGTQSWDSTSSIWVRDELVLESIEPLLARLNRVDILQHIEGELFTILEQFRGSKFRPKRYYPESIIRLVDKCLIKIAEHYLIIDVQPPPTRLMNLQTIIRFVLPITLNQLPSLSRLTQGHVYYFDLSFIYDWSELEEYWGNPMFMNLVVLCIDLIAKNGLVTNRELFKELTNSLDGEDVKIVPHIIVALTSQICQQEKKRIGFDCFKWIMIEFGYCIDSYKGSDEVNVEALKLHYYMAYESLIMDFLEIRDCRRDWTWSQCSFIDMAYKDILSHEKSKLICSVAFNLIVWISFFTEEHLTEKEMDKITMVALTTDACRAYDITRWLMIRGGVPRKLSVFFGKIVDRFFVQVESFKARYLNKDQDNNSSQLDDMFELTGTIIFQSRGSPSMAPDDYERLYTSVMSFAEFVSSFPELKISSKIRYACGCFMIQSPINISHLEYVMHLFKCIFRYKDLDD